MTFSNDVAERLGFYVYRLIDPRNGETFYVGKGSGNRVFAHIRGEKQGNLDEKSQKLQRIREIRLSGFEVAHVIHRHGLDSRTAVEVEAALIDAYPGVTNVIGGHHSEERGAMHANEIIERYEAPIAELRHKLVIINVNRTAMDRSVYDAVRYAWKIDPKRAAQAEYVLAVRRGLIVGVFVADEWLHAGSDSFAGLGDAPDGRWGFVGQEAPEDVLAHYVRKRLPMEIRKQGAANPVRYWPARASPKVR